MKVKKNEAQAFDWLGVMRDLQQLQEEIQPPFPPINAIETPDGFRYEVILAGYQKTDLHLAWEGYQMTLKANFTPISNQQESFLQQEYAILPFERTWNLPENTLPEKLEAKFENGILFVFLPKIS